MVKSTLSFNQFLQDHREKKKTIRGYFVLNLQQIDNVFQSAVLNYNSYSETWQADLAKTPEDDFTVIILRRNDNQEETYFFIKEFERNNKYAIFTYADHPEYEQFNRLLYSIRALWKPWLGSKFLENFNQFVKNYYADSKSELLEFTIEYRDVSSKKRKGSSRNWIPRKKEDISEVRRFHYGKFEELCYVKRGKYKVSRNGGLGSKLSLSDRGEFALYSGSILDFIEVGKGILDYSEHLKNILSSRLNYQIKVEQRSNIDIHTVTLDNLQVIRLDMSTAFYENWFDNLMKMLNIGYLSEFKIMLFEKDEDDTYFITEVMDMETGNKYYISTDKKQITIAPTLGEPPEHEAMSKILSALQSRVDPSINIGEHYGQIDASS
ncbi:MAG: hypothetical protein ABIC95_05955 [archaeon]